MIPVIGHQENCNMLTSVLVQNKCIFNSIENYCNMLVYIFRMSVFFSSEILQSITNYLLDII